LSNFVPTNPPAYDTSVLLAIIKVL
jgi:hypothetical protein